MVAHPEVKNSKKSAMEKTVIFLYIELLYFIALLKSNQLPSPNPAYRQAGSPQIGEREIKSAFSSDWGEEDSKDI